MEIMATIGLECKEYESSYKLIDTIIFKSSVKCGNSKTVFAWKFNWICIALNVAAWKQIQPCKYYLDEAEREFDREDIEEIQRFALETRRRVKEQQKR